MGPTTINGLPAHVLLVHVVVVLVPITVLLLLGSVFLHGLHRRLGIITPIVAFVTLVSVPLTTHAGEWLQRRVARTPLVAKHVEMGDGLLPWVGGLFIVACVAWYLRWTVSREPAREPALVAEGQPVPAHAATAPRTGGLAGLRVAADSLAAKVVLGVLAVALSAGALVQVYRIGDSGAKAAWTGNFSSTPHGGDHGDHD